MNVAVTPVSAARSAFLSEQIGKKWDWKERNCWEFAAHVEVEMFGRQLPSIALPDDPSWKWMVQTVSTHPEHENWREIADGPMGMVAAADGALCLMARSSGPGHVGVWLRPEQRVIHCDRQHGVCFEPVQALKQQGWRKLRFYEPKEIQCFSS
jgi:hypothetical protein